MNFLIIILIGAIILSLAKYIYDSYQSNSDQNGGGFDLNRQYWCDFIYKDAVLPQPDPIKLSKYIDKTTHSVTYADDMTQIGGPYRPPACPKQLRLPGPFDQQDPWRIDQIMCEVGDLCNWKRDEPSENRFEL